MKSETEDTDKRMEMAECLGWREISFGPRALGTVPGPAGFPPKGTIVCTLPTLAVLNDQLMKRTSSWLLEATDQKACDNCASQEGRHYCLLHSQQVCNMDAVRCHDWTPKS